MAIGRKPTTFGPSVNDNVRTAEGATLTSNPESSSSHQHRSSSPSMSHGLRRTPSSSLSWLLCLMVFAAFARATFGTWQDEIRPKIRLDQQKEGSFQSFEGNQTYSDHFKLLERDGDYLLVGARNLVYNISLRTLEEKKRLAWFSTEDDIRMCRLKGKSEEECQNYIRVLARKSEDTILVCGTNAYKPMCREYKQSDDVYTQTIEQAGVGLCPYDPNHNSTAIFAGPLNQRTDEHLYVATVAQFSGADPLIYRKPLRTEQLNMKHLNAPNFVNSLHHGEYVYFFFREIAVEYINCGKAVFSRVARVCTKDKGGPHKFRNQWTSFLKARLNCSISGEFPFYFNEIQSTSHIVEGTYAQKKAQLVYGVFTTPQNSISGSAVCAFSLDDILHTFEGSFKGQDDINSNWLSVPTSKVPEPRPGQCVNNSQTLPEMTVNFVKDHPLMDNTVPAFWGHPILLHTSFEYRFTYIAVDPQIETSGGEKYDVLFVGTDNGRILKAVNAGSSTADAKVQPIIIEDIVVFPHRAPVTNLMVYNTAHQSKLVVVSHEEIKTIPLHNCSRHAKTCSDCVGLQDPYCAWDLDRRICTSSPSRLWNRKNFIQNVLEGWHKQCQDVDSASSSTTSPSNIIIEQPKNECAPCPLTCVCPQPLGHVDNVNQNQYGIKSAGRPPPSPGSVPQRSPHHQASRHENQHGTNSASTLDSGSRDDGGVAGASRGHHYVYTAETLAIAVTTSIVSSLVVGFISGYVFSRRCRTEEVDSPYDDAHYLDQHHGSVKNATRKVVASMPPECHRLNVTNS